MINYRDFKKTADIKYGSRLKELHEIVNDLTLLESTKENYLNSISHRFCSELLTYFTYLKGSDAKKRYLNKNLFKTYISVSELSAFDIRQLRSYIGLKCNTIPELQSQINVLFTFLEMSITDYKHVLDIHNKEFGIGILKGYPMRLGRGLSKFQINARIRNKLVIDWEATTRVKRNLIARGITLYNQEISPLGEKYFVYRTDEKYVYVQWSKKDVNIPNKRLYCFKVTNYIHTEDRTMRKANDILKTNNDILYNEDIGILQKMNLLKERDSIINTIFKYNGI